MSNANNTLILNFTWDDVCTSLKASFEEKWASSITFTCGHPLVSSLFGLKSEALEADKEWPFTVLQVQSSSSLAVKDVNDVVKNVIKNYSGVVICSGHAHSAKSSKMHVLYLALPFKLEEELVEFLGESIRRTLYYLDRRVMRKGGDDSWYNGDIVGRKRQYLLVKMACYVQGYRRMHGSALLNGDDWPENLRPLSKGAVKYCKGEVKGELLHLLRVSKVIIDENQAGGSPVSEAENGDTVAAHSPERDVEQCNHHNGGPTKKRPLHVLQMGQVGLDQSTTRGNLVDCDDNSLMYVPQAKPIAGMWEHLVLSNGGGQHEENPGPQRLRLSADHNTVFLPEFGTEETPTQAWMEQGI